MNEVSTPQGRSLGVLTRLAFGVGGVADGIKNNGFEYFLLFYYSQVLGLSPGLVAGALMVALIVDAFSDPVIGYWSDNLRTPLGRRHPFMYAVALPAAFAYFFVWNPPSGASEMELFAWLLGFTVLVRLLFTFYEVPANTLAAELTDEYDARTSLMSVRYFFIWMGGLSIQVILLKVFLQPTADDPSGFFNLDGWHYYGVCAGIAIAIAILLCAGGTHRQIPFLKAPPPKRKLTLGIVFSEIFETVSNRSFRAMFIATFFGLLASGVSAGLNQYINSLFWGFTTAQVGWFTMGVYLSALMALGIAPVAGRILGKKRASIIIGLMAFTIAPAPVFAGLLGLMPPIGSEALFWTILIVTIFDLALIIAAQMLMASMVTDIVEDSELQTGRRSEGIFFAGISFIRKLSQGGGLMIASVVLTVAAITPEMRPETLPEPSRLMLGLGYGLTLLVMWMLMIYCISFYKISRDSHEANLAALAERENGGRD